MDANELNKILESHKKWLNNEGGEQANLSRANLSRANLSGANLSGADLSEANLSEADLLWANLSRANLSGADLLWTNLSRANLSGANLSGADLSWANLSEANLSGANLLWANLLEAVGTFATGYFGKFHAIAAGGYISIGCERYTYQEWLDNGVNIGIEYNFTPAEVDRYMAWIKLATDWLSEAEKGN